MIDYMLSDNYKNIIYPSFVYIMIKIFLNLFNHFSGNTTISLNCVIGIVMNDSSYTHSTRL